MKTIALRFSNNFAPKQGTIAAHEEIIHEWGFVWYGKLGLPVSIKAVDHILENENPRILLIHSGQSERYWAYVEKCQREMPDKECIPEYYRDEAEKFHTWFKLLRLRRQIEIFFPNALFYHQDNPYLLFQEAV